MFFDSWSSVGRVALVGVLAYIVLEANSDFSVIARSEALSDSAIVTVRDHESRPD